MRRILLPLSALTLVSVFGLCLSVVDYVRAARTVTWPNVVGVINSSEVSRVKGFLLLVTYKYEIQGRAYVNTRIQFGWKARRAGKEKELYTLFPAGSCVPVYYQPDAPGNSVLITGQHPETITSMGLFAAIFMLAALGWLGVLLWRRYNFQSPA